MCEHSSFSAFYPSSRGLHDVLTCAAKWGSIFGKRLSRPLSTRLHHTIRAHEGGLCGEFIISFYDFSRTFRGKSRANARSTSSAGRKTQNWRFVCFFSRRKRMIGSRAFLSNISFSNVTRSRIIIYMPILVLVYRCSGYICICTVAVLYDIFQRIVTCVRAECDAHTL